jgi:hypothetical protein
MSILSVGKEKIKMFAYLSTYQEITSSMWQMALEIMHERKEAPFTY